MQFVQIGREVAPILKSNRTHKAVITGIIDSSKYVILKGDGEHEVVMDRDVVLLDTVHDITGMKKEEIAALVKTEVIKDESTDFTRFIEGLKKQVEEEILREKGLMK